MSEKITDLEKFALEHVWRPYWPMHPNAGPRQANGTPERYGDKLRHTLMQTLSALQENREFREAVLSRLSGIGVFFPGYIKHDLATYITRKLQEVPHE